MGLDRGGSACVLFAAMRSLWLSRETADLMSNGRWQRDGKHDRYAISMLAFAEVLADAKGFEDVGILEQGRAGQVSGFRMLGV